ncbi:MAG TPA: hypothetical protein VGS21_08850 [Acidimicrobiales bacterium]|nr:hypothetical protein [Acidimicrobiales bacterium]
MLATGGDATDGRAERSHARKIIFVGGCTRSGSTVISDLIAQAPGVVSVGELANVWKWGYLENHLCGCGTPFLDCPFWNGVSQAAFRADTRDVPARDLAAAQQKVKGTKVLLQLWFPRLRTTSYKAALVEYVEVIESLYDAIASVSGADLIVDSSKAPHDARLLRQAGRLESHMVHVVRDSRGFSYAYTKHKVQSDVHWKYQELPRRPILRSVVTWSILNVMTELEGRRFETTQTCRYEEVMRSPGAMLASMADRFGEADVAERNGRTGREVTLPLSHTAAGNPSRFAGGTTTLRVDDEWVDVMPGRQRSLATLLTWPLLRRYGYPVAPWRGSQHGASQRSSGVGDRG